MRKVLLIIAIALSATSFGQLNIQDSATQGILLNINVGYFMKGGDFAEVFNPNFSGGLDLQYKTRSNWIFSIGARYHFADGLKDPTAIFGDLVTSQGEILGLNGEYAPVTYRERGWDMGFDVGKIFTSLGHNANSGPLFTIGAGYNNYYIDIRNQLDNTPQIQGEYLKGYDRFSQGLMTKQFLGYFFSGSRKRLNFTAGFEFMQGYNTSLREFNYDTRSYDTESKLDLYYGIRISWFLPFYDENAQKYYYY